MDTPPGFRRSALAALVGAPTGFFGGLVGLASSEYRLPFLLATLGYSARHAVPINLAVSLITLSTSLVLRVWATAAVPPAMPVVVPMLIAGVIGAYVAAAWVATRVSENRLRRALLVLLVIVGAVLVVEAATGERSIPNPPVGGVAMAAAIGLGLVFGALRSVLGTSGSILPTLVIVFGFEVNQAATATMLVALPASIVGAIRYARSGYLGDRRDWLHVVLPMGLASAVGAAFGVGLASYTNPLVLKIILGVILIVSSVALVGRPTRNPA